MNPSLFFRAFDLAFFLPGSLLLMHLLYILRSKLPWETLEKAGEKTVVGIIYIGGIVVVSFVIGLLCHCIARFFILKSRSDVRKFGQGDTSQPTNPNPYSGDDKSWIDYFWYLRATCWNTSVALFIMGWIELFASAYKGTLCDSYAIGLFVLFEAASIAMWYLGCDYHRAYEVRVRKHQDISNMTFTHIA